MENSMLESLVSFMLPSNILSRFTIVKVESNAETLFIHLDEIASADYVNDPNIESLVFERLFYSCYVAMAKIRFYGILAFNRMSPFCLSALPPFSTTIS